MDKLTCELTSPIHLEFRVGAILPHLRITIADSFSTLADMKREFDDLTPEWQRKFLTSLIMEKLDQ